MAARTPFFSAFQRLLFGKPPLSEAVKLLRQGSSSPALSQYRAAFDEFIPKASLDLGKSGENSRARIFPLVVTFWAFLAQVLERGSSCRAALRRIIAWWQLEFPNAAQPSVDTGGYCLARARLPQEVLARIGDATAERLENQIPSSELWLGRRVKILDGTGASMPDTAANQAQWPQSRSQQPGCGFPVVKLVGLFSMGSGALLHLAEGNKHQHEAVVTRPLFGLLKAGDVLVNDRGFCSYQALAQVLAQSADAVMRLHQARPADFGQGRRLGPNERLVTWSKPEQCPPGCPPETFETLPETLTLRLVRYRIETPGFRTEEVILITTLTDPVTVPLQALADLYFRRWQVELHFREIKTLLGLDVLRCLTPAIFWLLVWMRRQRRTTVAKLLSERATISRPTWEYRSRAEFLGLPLVHARIGGGMLTQKEPVKAWIAVGDTAIGGLFAFGGLAIAPVSIGGCAFGLVPFGGMAVGVLPLGGLAIGGWAFGGLAVGWQAFGACAFAWNAAAGGVAIAHDVALGQTAQALQVNNDSARAYIQQLGFFTTAWYVFQYYLAWMNLIWILPMLAWWRLVRIANRRVAHS